MVDDQEAAKPEDKPGDKFVYRPLSEEQLEQLAQDIAAGQVFHSGICDVKMLPMVFMPLGLIEKARIKEMLDQGVSFFYEYMNKAGERSVNGYPMFMSFNTLNKEQTEIVHAKCREIDDYLKKRLAKEE